MKRDILLSLLFLISAVFAQEAVIEDSCIAEKIRDYNIPMRVGGLFVILGTSAIGVFTPIILHKRSPYTKGSVRDWVLTIGKFFGTGAILATAFVHILPAALFNFSSPCLSNGWKSYGAFAGVFCMASSFAIQLMELAAIENLRRLQDKKALRKLEDDVERVENKSTTSAASDTDVSATLYNEREHIHGAGVFEESDAFKHIGTLILELGIVMHSIIIGVTLSNSRDDQFITLLIALAFHQFFEGVALGTRIQEMNTQGWKKPTLMGLFFCSMTPFGCAIGIGVHTFFQADLPSSILASAILDSLSAGILLYNGYITLMSKEMNQNPGFCRSTTARKAICFFSMYFGAGVMAIIGKWA